MAILNPLDKSSGVVLTNNNLTYSTPPGEAVRTDEPIKGKIYVEFSVNNGYYSLIGFATKDSPLIGAFWDDTDTISCGGDGSIRVNGVVMDNIGGISDGDIVGIAVDTDKLTFTFFLNGVVKYTGKYSNAVKKDLYFMAGAHSGTGTGTLIATNPFNHTIPNGYKAYGTISKTLILTDGKYKSYNNGWVDTTNQLPTLATFIEEGMDIVPVQINDLTTDFEIVNWTNEVGFSKKLEIIDAIPSPQFIHTTTLSKVTSNIVNILSSDLSSTSTTSNVRYLLTDNNITWKKWNGTDFVDVSFSTVQNILNIGMTYGEITAISDWSKWTSAKINIGVYLQDSKTITSKVRTLGFTENSPKDSSILSNVNFYILNTTAKIELDLQGLLLSGYLSDLDSTRVQYKVTLNGQPYYPASGGYTSLSPSPQNIDITFKSSEIKMNDWNTLRVDFKDYFGTEDYWQTTFVGNYSALMFMDVDGNYYSDDIGKVLQYLDFGTIVAGEVTVAHEVIVKNQYGYAVKDLQLEASHSNLPEGVDIQLSKANDPFEPEQSLLFEDGLDYEDQTSFYVRMATDVDSVPNDTKSFNIFVSASRKGV